MQNLQTEDSLQMLQANTTVFVVDDEAAVRQSMARLLCSAGWQCEVFASASDLLESAQLNSIGCILLDVQMPDMDGLELQKRLLKTGISLPVIFLTGKADIPMTVQAMKQGAVNFLTKPVEEDVLFWQLEHSIRKHASEKVIRHHREYIKSKISRLSRREAQVLEKVLHGSLNKQIAFDLDISEKTVKVHRGRVMEKMEANNIAQLIQMCNLINIQFPCLQG